MKIIEQNPVTSNRYKSSHYYDEIEIEHLKKQRLFKFFLYSTVVLFALVGIVVVSFFAINLGALVTIAASICFGGWWAAYTLIVLHETNKEQ